MRSAEGISECDGLTSASVWRSYGHRVADAVDAASLFPQIGRPIIAFPIAVVARPPVQMVKPFALIVTDAKEQVMAKTLHTWQKDALAEAASLYSLGETEMSVEAGVGSGKTFFASQAFLIFKAMNRGDFVIVVTINRRCQRQWAKTMSECGILLKKLSGNSSLSKGIPPDVQGYICTYASMGRWPDLHAAFVGAHRTYVIFDEVHHINEDGQTTWGAAAVTAFSAAAFKLSLSGTYFASNGAKIPFARMKPMAGSNAVFEYDPHKQYLYGESVADRICRRIMFKPFDGPIEYKREGDTDFRIATFGDEIDERDYGARLWAAVQPKGEQGQPNQMLAEMLFRANRQLMDIRIAGHAKAGGLIICDDTVHARRVRDLIEHISGHRAVLVLNDEEGSDHALDAFAHGSAAWLVAVQMVTEGVDIPRLRIGIYLTRRANAPLSFLQFLGRMVRHFKGNPDTISPESGDPAGEAYCYYPADQRLVELASKVEEEIKAAINFREKQRRNGGDNEPIDHRRYQSGAVDGEEQDNIIAGDRYSASEIEAADQLRVRWPNLAEEQILEMVKFVREATAQPRQKAPPSPLSSSNDADDDHDSLRRECATLAKKLAKITAVDFNLVHVEGNRFSKITNIEAASVAQFKTKRAWLNEQIAIALDPAQNGWQQKAKDVFDAF